MVFIQKENNVPKFSTINRLARKLKIQFPELNGSDLKSNQKSDVLFKIVGDS